MFSLPLKALQSEQRMPHKATCYPHTIFLAFTPENLPNPLAASSEIICIWLEKMYMSVSRSSTDHMRQSTCI